MGNYYLAVDIGASSGRHILGHVENGKITYEEVYRFENNLERRDGHLCWNIDRLFNEIVNGIAKCKEIGKIPVSMGIDTWGVDFVLLDENDNVLGDTVAYRDSRTEGIDKELYKIIPEKELYARTGIQKALFNSVYQLYAIKKEHPEYIKSAKSFLMIPEYFNFLLTGVKKNEYTNATTGQLVNAVTKDWDYEIIDRLGYNKEMFGQLNLPKTSVGTLKKEIIDKVGYDMEVILPATHEGYDDLDNTSEEDKNQTKRINEIMKEYRKEYFAEGPLFYFLKAHNYSTYYGLSLIHILWRIVLI